METAFAQSDKVTPEIQPVDALALVQSVRGQIGHGIDICGTPLHKTAAELADFMAREGIEEFLAHEARHSVGNYVIVWRQGSRATVITAPGYGGGYIRQGARHLAVATTLAEVLALTPDPVEADPFGMAYYLSHAPASNFNMLPFTTMFRGVRRLPPGSVVVMEKARLARFQTYLNLEFKIDPPATFRAALEEVATAIAVSVRRDNRKVLLMFSGGAGSLALWLSLRDQLDPSELRLVCIDQAGTNGPSRALPVARALGIEVEVLDQSSGEALLLDQFKHDMPAFLSPHVAVLGQENLLVLNGQNFDVLVNGNMEVLPEFHEAGYLSDAASRITNTDARVMRRDKTFIANLAFTDAYLADEAFQKISAPFFAAQLREANPDPSPGADGVLRGLMSRRLPNILSPARYPLKQVQYLNTEVSMFNDYLSNGSQTVRMRFDLMNFLAYAQLAAKRQSGKAPGAGSEMVFPSLSGPLASYYLCKERSLSEANQPKREIYAYIRAQSGIAYRTLIKADPENPVPPSPPRPALEDTQAFSFAAAMLRDSAEPSPLLEGLREPAVRAHVFEAIEKLRDGLKPGKVDTLTEFQKNLLIRVGNLLSILKTVSGRQASAATSRRTKTAVLISNEE